MPAFLLLLFNAIIFGIYCYVVSRTLLNKKEDSFKSLALALIPLLSTYYCVVCLLESIHATFFTSVCACYFIRIAFKENMFMSLLIALVLHSFKIAIKAIVLIIINSDKYLLVNTYKTFDMGAFNINVVTFLIAGILIILFRNPLRKLLRKISSMKRREMILLIFAYACFAITILYQPPIKILSLSFISDFSILFIVTTVAITGMSSEKKLESLNEYYVEMFDYSKANDELLNEYKMKLHENKNKFLMIKSMLNGPKKDLKKYVDEVVKELSSKEVNYWIAELRKIPLLGVRNFLKFKLCMLKKLGAEIEFFVSNELEDIDTSNFSKKDYNHLTTILGVLLDNMIDAIKETDEKLVSINIYIDDDVIHCDFVNTFTSDVDMNRLKEVGYTTKGAQHGVGLPLVAKIVKSNDRYKCTPNIIDNFFSQHLEIKLYNNLQKK